MSKTAKIFKNGASQAVRLPAEFRFEGGEVFIGRDPLTGNVILSAAPLDTWDSFFELRRSFEALTQTSMLGSERCQMTSFASRSSPDMNCSTALN